MNMLLLFSMIEFMLPTCRFVCDGDDNDDDNDDADYNDGDDVDGDDVVGTRD